MTIVEEVLFGARGEEGVVHINRQLVKDIYNEQQGALVRLAKLEVDRSKVDGMVVLGKIVWHLVTFGAGIAIALLIKK